VLFQIESGIECPSPNLGRKPVYRWDDMNPGTSVRIKAELKTSARSSLNTWKRKHPNQTFITRTDEEGAVRVWRIT